MVCGHGLHGLREASTIIDAGNSGTTLRLMMGILAPQPFLTTFTGDASLHKRPMGRVIKPLSAMGAKIYGREKNTKLPITIVPAEGKLHGMVYESPVASAQVKSAILLSGNITRTRSTTVVSPSPRATHGAHAQAFGVGAKRRTARLLRSPVGAFRAPEAIEVPGDISSAAYWLVAGSVVPGSQLLLKNVGVNPTRTGILDVLEAMGAKITLENERVSGGEAAADIRVEAAKLHGTSFGAEIMPRLIDEIPVRAVAALFAEGDTVITGAGELRVKETDRLQAVTDEFNKLAPGAVEASEDGLVIPAAFEGAGGNLLLITMTIAWRCRTILGAAGEGAEIEAPRVRDDLCRPSTTRWLACRHERSTYQFDLGRSVFEETRGSSNRRVVGAPQARSAQLAAKEL